MKKRLEKNVCYKVSLYEHCDSAHRVLVNDEEYVMVFLE